eukprot:394372-Rhodomonas_salina.2
MLPPHHHKKCVWEEGCARNCGWRAGKLRVRGRIFAVEVPWVPSRIRVASWAISEVPGYLGAAADLASSAWQDSLSLTALRTLLKIIWRSELVTVAFQLRRDAASSSSQQPPGRGLRVAAEEACESR